MAPAELLDAVVRLRLAIERARDPLLREELREIELALRKHLGPSVRKGDAARVLGVSVPALDRWIDRGRIPVVAKPASSRLGVETRTLLDLAAAVRRLRSEGVRRGVLARALTSLGRRDRGVPEVLRADVAALPRPNVPAEELRHAYETTSPEQRLAELAALHRSLNALLVERASA